MEADSADYKKKNQKNKKDSDTNNKKTEKKSVHHHINKPQEKLEEAKAHLRSYVYNV